MSCATGSRIEGVSHFDVKITEHNLDNVAKLLIGHIKKDWDVNSLCRKDFNDGITNKLVGYYMKVNTEDATKFEYGRTDIVLVRIYGQKTELIINRAQELRNIEELSRNHICPPLYCTFSNGYCYKFVEGEVCTPKDFTNKDILKLSAQYMAKIHSTKLSENYLKHHKMESTVFATIKEYIHIMPKSFGAPEKQAQYEKEKLFCAKKLLVEVETLIHAVNKLNKMPVTFCHNDLLVANLIYNEYEGRLHCIDHEYGTPNYSAYDIANHFNEFAGVDTVDYSLYPSKETQISYLKLYLEKMNELNGINTPVLDENVEEWYIHVEHMSLVSHFFWGVWAAIQAYHSQIDFDFLGYGTIRLNEYHKRKKEVLARYMNELIL